MKQENSTLPTLQSVTIKNYHSLRDVTLELKPLTVLVGPNGSGKSNCLSALNLIRVMLTSEEVPPKGFIRESLWVDGAKDIEFSLTFAYGETTATYAITLSPTSKFTPFKREVLQVGTATVIQIERGKGWVNNENGSYQVPYNGIQLALKSAGLYGNKPVTNAIVDFIKSWEFYDIDPDYIREERRPINRLGIRRLDPKGGILPSRLSRWSVENPDILAAINKGMKHCGGIEFEIKGNGLRLQEGLSRSLPYEVASDGTLRLLFYYTLPYQPELPAFIGIEEPERNLHPGALSEIGKLLEQLARKTQVIITTHSSQLLDCFSPENLSGDLAVILLNKRSKDGTHAIALEKIRDNREGLRDWMTDFGIGNAVFHSQLLQDLMEK